ncbi:MAG: mannitol-phosphate 5-dehydrogenase [Candidatus Sumerlaeota bacterium]|nr:mannitol-phosphate 5-dehydrogenase [Candidatus Sumerlaeota bacterium]
MSRTFTGFGFGPIQSGLFLYEAWKSGNFGRYVVAEVDAAIVKAVRDNGGAYVVNIAHRNGIEQARLEGIEIYNPADALDRERLLEAIAEADELATALPSVRFYDMGAETSVVRLLAEGLKRRSSSKPAILYAAENNNHAAEVLTESLAKLLPAAALANFEVLNTVIGKMSGVITDADTMTALGLAPATPSLGRAVLVEEFNRILVSRPTLSGFRRGIGVFAEKADLLPFEEAKLYGHNAIHATIAYLADLKGLRTVADAAAHADIMQTARAAFIDESGAALIKRHAALGDPLFTPDGYRAFAEDLLERMVNPYLNDLIERVTRDPIRKLGYEDRLYGTMRIALEQGIEPRNLAKGASAALISMIRRQAEDVRSRELPLPSDTSGLTRESAAAILHAIWRKKADEQAPRLIDLTWQAFG